MQRTPVDSVVEQFDSQRIASKKQTLLAHVPDCQAEHTVQAVKHLVAPLFVAVDNDFGVRFGAEDVAALLELALELLEVVDFTVKGDPDGFLGVRHGLMAARKVDNREPAETEAQRAVEKVPFIIGTTMDDGVGHGFDVPAPNGGQASEVILSADATHERSLVCRFRFEKLETISRVVAVKPACFSG